MDYSEKELQEIVLKIIRHINEHEKISLPEHVNSIMHYKIGEMLIVHVTFDINIDESTVASAKTRSFFNGAVAVDLYLIDTKLVPVSLTISEIDSIISKIG